MKTERKRGLSRAGEHAVITALLAVYAIAIVLSPDPEWVVWAGQMTVGVIDPSALPPSSSAGAGEAFRTASALSALGFLAVVVLPGAAVGMRPGGWLSRLVVRLVAGHGPAGIGTGRHA